jgi:hypothetical protein
VKTSCFRVEYLVQSMIVKVKIPEKIKLRFVAFDESSRSEVNASGGKHLIDLTLKVTRF